MILSLGQRSLVIGLAVLCVQCSLPSGEYFGKVKDNPDPTHLRWCNSGEPEYIDPALATSTTGTPLARLMFSGLADFDLDAEGTPIPSIASSWDISADQRRFTFHLRKDVKWSNGRALTAADFLYHTARLAHPTTMSRNQSSIEYIKNVKLFGQGRLRTLQGDVAPFAKGEVVAVVGINGAVEEDLAKAEIPSSNIRKSSKALRLRDYRAEETASYATVPPGEEVEIIEIHRGWKPWAYVFYMGLEWRYGWVPLTDLDIEPNAETTYTIVDIEPEHRVGESLPPDPAFKPRQATANGRDLLMLPDALGVQSPDPYTLVVETSGPTPYLIDDVATRTFRPTPRESVSRSPLQWTRPAEGLLVTSGPFNLKSWKPRNKLSFIKSQTFFDKDIVKLERLTALSIDDQAASTNIYSQGGCDATAANNIPYSYLPMMTGAKRGGKAYKDFVLAPYDGIYYFVINTEKLQNVHLRRALNMSIDRSPLPRILHGGEVPSTQFVPGRAISELSPEERELCGVSADTPGMARIVSRGEYCYVGPPGLAFDVDKAREELAIARKELGAAFPKNLDFKYNTGSEGHKVVAEFVQQEWKKNLGLNVSLSTMEWKTYLKETTTGNFYIARMGWIGGPPDPEGQFHLIFKCGSPYNRARWCNKEYDRLFEEASNTVDRKKRLQLLSKAEGILLQDAPIIPMYAYKQKLLTRPYVRDLPVNMGANPPLHRAWIDPDWKQHAAEATP